MVTFLIVLSGALTLVSVAPYIIETVRGNTKPRVVSWFTWALLTGVGCGAAFADGEYPAAALLAANALATLSVGLLGLRYGDRSFERFDIMCQVGVLVGLVLWLIFNSPAVAIVATVTIDFIGALPTIKHSWQKPYEETWITFALGGLGSLCTVLIVGSWKITAILFPLYLMSINLLLTGIIVVRHKYVARVEPVALRKV